MAQIIFLFFSGVFAGTAVTASYHPDVGDTLWFAISSASFYATAWLIHDKA